MKEIKFRARDKELCKMLMSGKHPQEENSLFWANAYGLPLMQYTGLKDKNGKEIYFDDIIKHQEYLYQVVWNVDKLGFKQLKVTITDFSIYSDGGECVKQDYGRYFERKKLFNFDSSEIIGNVYENPNLLT